MKKWYQPILFLAISLLAGAVVTVKHKTMEDQVLRHVVLFKFKDSSTKSDVDMVCQAFADLPGAIQEIKAFEWGENNSPEGLNQGLTHCFLLTFDSEADRDTYLIHPAHKAFGQKVGAHLDKVTVVDYWSR